MFLSLLLSLLTLLRRSCEHFPAVKICYFKTQCPFYLLYSSKMTLWRMGSLEDLEILSYEVR